MQIISLFVNHSLQKSLIEDLEKENIPHRIRADKSIQTAKKWEGKILDLCSDILLELFDEPAIYILENDKYYETYIIQLAKHNIPFFTYIVDGQYTISTSSSDSWYIADHIKINMESS